MEVSKRAGSVAPALRTLRVRDLDVEVERIAAEIALRTKPGIGSRSMPVRISTAEFVRRVSAFICFN